MTGPLTGLITAALLAASPGGTGRAAGPGLNPMVSKAKERDEFIAKLKRDIFKVDRAIGETEKLISKSRNAPYLPDLQFRLAELFVEKSRYVYYLQAESRPEGASGAIVSPETRLMKQKAVQMYYRLLREYPDFKDGDQVTFYLAHEQRELGQFDEMLKTLGDLTRKFPNSPLRLESEQILGDHFFDKADLVEAERHYQAILEAPPSPVHDLARYKMGWIRVNQAKHAEAVTFFEAAAASAPLPGMDVKKALNVKREALLDLVYSYTEAKPPKGALNYFEKLSESRATYALALDKLGNRYFIKQQYEWAIPALRKLMEIQHDPELDLERGQKLYDALKASKGKVLPEPEDLRILVRAAVQSKTDPELSEVDRKKQLVELEEMGRDLATLLHLAAQKKEEKELYLSTAEAYEAYLSLFRPDQYVRPMMKNRAEALFSAKDYTRAARQFEELARYESKAKDAKGEEEALYAALLAHFSTLKPEEALKRNAYEVADARQAMKLLGAEYVSRYPKSPNVLDVKFNIARAFYEDGDYPKAAELFTAFALTHPQHKEATVAGNLALDSLRQVNDFKGLDETGKKFLTSPLPGNFRAEVQKILTQSRAEALDELALQSAQETGDVIQGLVKVADENKNSDIGEKALYGAFTAAREKRDLQAERDLGAKLVQDYPKSQYLSDVLLTLGRHAAEAAAFGEAATWFEQVGQKLGADIAGVDGWLAGARLRMALGEYKEAARNLETAAEVSGARKSEVLVLLAEARLKAKDYSRAKLAADAALKLDPRSAGAAAVLAEVQAVTAPTASADALVATLTTAVQGPNGQTEEAARGLWFLGEILYRGYKDLPADKVEEKVAALQSLEGIYTQAASLGYPEWAVASLWRLALAYGHIADVVESTPVPGGLSASESQQFQAAVKEQVGPLKTRSEEAFKACLSRAESLEVFSAAVVGCRSRAEQAALPVPQPGAPTQLAALDDLRKKAERTLSVESLEALGMAYLEARQFGVAQLTFGRVTELQDTKASAHSALGWALLNMGDAMGARAAYAKAMDSDPTYDKARLNLAALRCRFGDVDGARRDLAVLKDVGSLNGADVDTAGWKACK
ncbi:outer membrane protein assembly factor BamD [Myxococcus llanfairpwllgwyngyllgogerychwyrndrobwllllantysiliogogogochensis]|uniref:Outer membrane protein assembly factor BamD n=1 Tax=Myxococcus llanfairpwllgwyngyllgogerychwyrndrobwllllantysiliogogogochensis TaxID=2590453 RepID=A0A540X563_9BACT|nr:tetratricopeptide repeat protein [Myxococcus llanfairpwllgwyngyllgogerychwyrndrobwllllantysiliogogogochensis]TQF16388.1 outer membrane protein assembly factor BamD [Myxococcus llanfairpwllgwyngyllgogerychwyrndrobwllllantysiliogogogochensis]